MNDIDLVKREEVHEIGLCELLMSDEGKEFVKEKMFLTDEDIAKLQFIAPIFDMISHGTPPKYAFASNLDGLGMSYYKFKELYNRGSQLIADSNEELDFFAVAIYRLGAKAQNDYINALTNVAFEDATKNKNPKTALQLLQMSVNEFKKNFIQTDDGDVSQGSGKLEITFAGSGLSDEERLKMIDEELKKDIQ